MQTTNGVTYYYGNEMPMGPIGDASCTAQCPNEEGEMGYGCTRTQGHPSPHQAQGIDGRVMAEWS